MEQFVGFIIEILLKLVGPLVKLIKWIYSKLPFEIKSRKNKPKLGIIEHSYKNNTWENSKNKERDGISINTNWHLTNALPYNLTALNVKLSKPKRIKGTWMAKDTKSDYWGHYGIPRGYTTDVSFSFWLENYQIKNPEKILEITIEITDPVGRTHIIKNVKIQPALSKKPKAEEEIIPVENPVLTKNPIEKKVIAVLKDETEQYAVRGRRGGYLGTVEWPRGTIEWHTDGETIKFLNASSAPSLVKSSNCDALVKIYKKSSKNDKNNIKKALMSRLNRDTEYRNVGYIILLTLFELGFLEQGLKVALKNLENDGKLGFSDTLRLLDFLLAFRYEEFSDKDLDIVEKVAFSTNEHAFRIKQRINAIRIQRIDK